MHIQTTNLNETFRALRSKDPQKMANAKIPQNDDYKSVPKQNYSPVGTTNTGGWGNGMAKFASAASSNTIYGQPQFFSPVHTPINWQIPSKRMEQYQWARHFYENEPKVAAAIDFYSSFPMSDWEHECRDRKVKVHFDKLKKRINLPKWCRLISHEVHLLGDCFPFQEVSCDICNGSGRVGDQICDHEGGTVKRIIILNPDFVDVHSTPLSAEPLIALRPDDELINMVQRKIPGYEVLSPEVIRLISSGQPIRLDSSSVAHLKYGENGYSKYGIGMVKRLFPILSYKTKLMVAQWIVAERLIVPIKIVKVGSDERPAGPADIAAVQAQLAETANDPNLTIVTHHAFELEWIGASGSVLTLSNEMELINQEILDGMMINNALLNGEGPNFCLSDDSKILTDKGLKLKDDLDINNDLIATLNKDTGALEYQRAIRKYEYNWDSISGNSQKLKHFKTDKIDMLVTPNHKMLWIQNKDWQLSEASDVGSGFFRLSVDSFSRNSCECDTLEDTLFVPIDKYVTESAKDRDNMLSLFLRSGYCTYFETTRRFDKEKGEIIEYTVFWNEDKVAKITSSSDITDVDYVGKVWCVEVPNHIIITERNGKIGIHGNSAAAVGIEAMIQRLSTFRDYISQWIEEFVYLPEAKRQGFIDVHPETDEEEYIVPKIKWNSMHLRDQQQYRTFILQLYEKGLVSGQTVLEAFEIDADQEIERKRHDAVQQMALGQNQQGGAAGGADGGMGGGFGGGGGMPPPMGGGGGDMGGGEPPVGPPGGDAPPMAQSMTHVVDVADPKQFGNKILKKKTREKVLVDQKKQQVQNTQNSNASFSKGKDGQTRDEKGRIVFTKLERVLIDHFIKSQKEGIIKYKIIPQYRIMIGGLEHPVDFAMPQIKLVVEADGEVFHSSPKQLQKDQERDKQLAQMGWTVLRFKDSEIEKQIHQVMNKVVQTIGERENYYAKLKEKDKGN